MPSSSGFGVVSVPGDALITSHGVGVTSSSSGFVYFFIFVSPYAPSTLFLYSRADWKYFHIRSTREISFASPLSLAYL